MTGAPLQSTTMIDQLVAAERTRVLYSGIKTAAITGPIGVAVLALLFWQTVDHWKILVWAISSAIVICPASLGLLAHFQRNNRLPDDARHWLRLAVLRYFVISAAFGSAGAALFVADSATGQMMLFCYLVALSLTLTAETAQHPWIYTSSLPALLAPFILRASLEDSNTAGILAILATAALVFVLLTARNLGKMIHESLLMRFKNQELVAQLQIQKQLPSSRGMKRIAHGDFRTKQGPGPRRHDWRRLKPTGPSRASWRPPVTTCASRFMRLGYSPPRYGPMWLGRRGCELSTR